MKTKSELTLSRILRVKKCKKCGKRFIAAPEHRFHVGEKFYCSWTCYLHRDDKVEKKDDKRTT